MSKKCTKAEIEGILGNAMKQSLEKVVKIRQ